MYRQGDVLLIPAASRAGEEVPAVDGAHVLVRGVTDHAHTLRGAVKVYSDGDARYVVAVEPFRLVHEVDGRETGEHATIEVPAGTYLVVVQSQYDRGAVRDVED